MNRKQIIPATAIALGLLSAPLYADGLLDNARQDAPSTSQSREASDTRLGERISAFRAEAGERRDERQEQRESLASDQDFGDSDFAEDGDKLLAQDEPESLPGLGSLDASLEGGVDEGAVDASANGSATLAGETAEGSFDYASDRSGALSGDEAARSTTRDVSAQLGTEQGEIGYDGSAERSAMISRSDDGFETERSREASRSLEVGDRHYETSSESTRSRSVETDGGGSDALAIGQESDEALFDSDSADFDESDLDPTES